jgi:hypothetical protein
MASSARLMFPHLWINEAACEQFLSGIRNYRKQWDENLLLFRPEPVHDWASRPADVPRYLSLVEPDMLNTGTIPPPTTGLVKPFYPGIGV